VSGPVSALHGASHRLLTWISFTINNLKIPATEIEIPFATFKAGDYIFNDFRKAARSESGECAKINGAAY
jgi:hypothetical protein